MVDFIESLIQSNGILIAFIALLSGVIGAILKGKKDLEIKYDVDLKDKRIGYYQNLLKNLKPLALYSPSSFVTYGTLIKISENLKEWYYNMGGLFLTHTSRKKYGIFQEEIQTILKKMIKNKIQNKIINLDKDEQLNYLESILSKLVSAEELNRIKEKLNNQHIYFDIRIEESVQLMVEELIKLSFQSVLFLRSLLTYLSNDSKVVDERISDDDLDKIKDTAGKLRTSLTKDISSRRDPKIKTS